MCRLAEMLAALAVGLASGVGLYLLATFGTIFVGVVLWIIESFEPRVRKVEGDGNSRYAVGREPLSR